MFWFSLTSFQPFSSQSFNTDQLQPLKPLTGNVNNNDYAMFCWDTLGSHIATWSIQTLDILFGVCCLSPIHEGRTSQHTGQPRRSFDHALTDQKCFVCTSGIYTILSRLVLMLCMIIASFLLQTLRSLLLVSAHKSWRTGIRSRTWR